MKKGRPKRTEWPECRFEGCTNTTKKGAKGFCFNHYMATRRGQIDVETGEELRPPKRVRSYGPGARCIVPECGSRPVGRGLCSAHWQRWKKGEDVGVKVPEADSGKSLASYPKAAECKVPGCERRPVNRWMCNKHAIQRQAGIIDEDGNKLREKKNRGRLPKGYRTYQRGYLKKMCKGHPNADKDGYVLEHRLVMEEHVGRYLTADEVVHHINGTRDDNRIENLQLRTKKSHGYGHEPIQNVEEAITVLEKLVNKKMSGGERVAARMKAILTRLQ